MFNWPDPLLGCVARGPIDAIDEMLDELRLMEVLRVVPHVGIPDPAAFVSAAPGW